MRMENGIIVVESINTDSHFNSNNNKYLYSALFWSNSIYPVLSLSIHS